jgi:hypothetical protein
LPLSPTSLWERCVIFGIGEGPRSATLGIRAVAPQVFCELLVQIERGANVEFACELALENVGGGHEEIGTPDLPGNAGTLYFYLNPKMVGTRRLELLTSTVSR